MRKIVVKIDDSNYNDYLMLRPNLALSEGLPNKYGLNSISIFVINHVQLMYYVFLIVGKKTNIHYKILSYYLHINWIDMNV